MYREIVSWLYIRKEDKEFDMNVLTYGLEIIGVIWGKLYFFGNCIMHGLSKRNCAALESARNGDENE